MNALLARNSDHETIDDDSGALLSLSRHEYFRRWTTRLLFILDLISLALVLAHSSGIVMLIAGMIQGLFVPGWSVVRRLKISSVALEVGLVLATSLALVMIYAQILITIDFWHLWAAQIFWGLFFTLVLALDEMEWRPDSRLKFHISVK